MAPLASDSRMRTQHFHSPIASSDRVKVTYPTV
jgi:hypothetical protein